MTKRLIRGQMIIEGTGRPPIEAGAVLYDDKTIMAVGKAADMEIDPDTEEVDCSDQVLIPGLIDCHNHLSLDTTLDNYLYRMNDAVPELTLRAVASMTVDLDAGVTTSRCCGDKEFLDIACRQAVESGRFEGPRLLVAGKGIRASHGHGFVGYPFDGLESVRSAVRENLRAGADLIKLYVTGTLKGSTNIPAYLSKSEISLAVQEAKRLQVKTATHCIGGIGMDWAIELGIDSVEHGYFMSEEQIDRMAQSESWLVMTPSPFFAEERIRTLPSHLKDDFRRERDEVADRMAAAIKGGVKFAVGTDGMHGGLAKEMEYITEFGASAEEALLAATLNGAKVCGLSVHIGTLEPGKSADIVGVKGNPLKEIQALKRVKTVIHKGKIKRVDNKQNSEN
jgi:imidazolonepropionase-like amidohydrolase